VGGVQALSVTWETENEMITNSVNGDNNGMETSSTIVLAMNTELNSTANAEVVNSTLNVTGSVVNYVLTIRPLASDVPVMVRLRGILKRLLRSYDFRCVTIEPTTGGIEAEALRGHVDHGAKDARGSKESE
jgi:hypothetical protein